MSSVIQHVTNPLALPAPRIPVTVRPATPGDLLFMDKLQKLHVKQVGWMPTKQLEEKINAGHVLVAETEGAPTGYVMGRDQYFKRDDVGIIYQMNVVPGCQRNLVGATLLKAVFERSAYGCKLFCCWCAQDIGANHFWEAMGFVPLAFRAGSAKKGRVHIFWQKRIRSGDTTTPWWFPSQTNAGAMNADRLVLPIPPGTRWSDAMPVILPTEESTKLQASNHKQITSSKEKIQKKKEPAKPATIARGGLWFASAAPPAPEDPKPQPPKGAAKPKKKNDPKLVAAARELRDRYLDHVNGNGEALLPTAKYEVRRSLEAPRGVTIVQPDPKHLPTAA